MIEHLLVLIARVLLALLRALPLAAVARLGRWGGGLAFWLDRRHRRVALCNLTAVFGREKSPSQIRALARENFRRIGESFVCGVRTAGMSQAELDRVLEVCGAGKLCPPQPGPRLENRVVALGHFGNFELLAHLADRTPGYRFATTYRALRPPGLNQLLLSFRESSGCLFFERRTDAKALRSALSGGGLILGLLSDQKEGRRGIPGPFLGIDCSTSAGAALLALRYRCGLFTAICYRTSLGRWRIEVGDPIPTKENGQPRPVEEITRDINRAFEEAVRRDPANWFWVHNRWGLARRR